MYQVMQAKIAQDQSEMSCMAIETANPIEELMMVMEMMRKNQHHVSPNLLIDIKRHYPHASALFRLHMDQHIMKSILENIQKGISQGLYRDDIDPSILARMRVEQIELAFNNDFFPGESIFDARRTARIDSSLRTGYAHRTGIHRLQCVSESINQSSPTLITESCCRVMSGLRQQQ